MANQWNGQQGPWQGEDIPMSSRQTHHNPGYQDNSLPLDYDRPTTVNMVPTIDIEERRGSDSSEEFDRHRRSSRRKWATTEDRRDIQEMIDALPSRQLEQLASDTANRTSLKRRNSSKSFKRRGGSLHGTIRITRGHDPEEIIQTLARNDDYMDELDGDLRTAKAVRDMQLHMKEKRNIKKNASDIRRQKTLKRQTKQLGWFKRTKYSIGMSWMHLKQKMAEFAYSLELWKSHLKKIEGHFGTGVTSYFLFLKWIFLLNIPVCILTLGFVVIPQVIYRYYMKNPPGYDVPVNTSSHSFTGEELLTGGNWFEDTEMYYGFYTNETIRVNNLGDYDMKFAYLFTCGGYYILTLIILALSISRSYKMNYIEGSGTQTFYMVSRVFCGWDYNITDTAAASLRHKSFFNEMKEFLSGKKKPEDDVKKLEEKCKWFFIRLLTNLFILGSIGGLAYMIYVVYGKINTDIPILKDLALPLTVSATILVVPPIFSLIARIESYEQPKNELYMNMLRTMLLKASILGILVYFWFTKTSKDRECWETQVGQEIYRLVIVDFIFTLGATFCLEFLRRIFATYCCKLKNPSPEFDIGRNTLDLIYSQALCWLGTYFSPLLSVIMIMKLFIIFYIKRISVLQNCRPSLRPWRAARTHTIFMGFLFFFFLMATVAVAVGIIIIDSSHSCGPYRHENNIDHYYAYKVVLDLIDSWRGEVVYEIISVITSPGSIALVLVALCVGTYYMRIVMIGHKEMVTLLRQQLAMEGRDKAYLLRMLQEASKKRKMKPSNINRTLAPQTTSSELNPGQRSPEWDAGGHRFVRTIANSAAASGSYLETNNPRGRRRMDHNGTAGGAAPH